MFGWKDAYSVNVNEIDEQHKELFRIAGKIYDLVHTDADYDHFDEVMSILQKLKEYTLYHFQHEEKLMEKYGYRETDSHKIEHLFLIKKLQKFEKDDIDMERKDSIIELITFVSDWISGHILKTDMKYKDFFNKNGLY
ncbi:bacteriohemerythrin [Lutispora sp.]|nr:bacteriohemerythrin [Lutispora sp.]MEA4961788.1 bacteriohemerythrin [Lutispora sp.]HCJ57592.1 bacteriohemerythrin [Clostridiaceae bacterium]